MIRPAAGMRSVRRVLTADGRRASLGRRARTAAVVLAVCGVLLATAAVGARRSHPADKADLASGAIWLASRAAGQIALVDGISEQVAASVSVGPKGRRFVVTQREHDAYVGYPDGHLVRVDGATLARTAGTMPPADDLVALPGALYLLDGRRRQVQSADPRDLTPLSEVPTHYDGDAATVSDGHRLWLLDRRSGRLSRVAAGTAYPVRFTPPVGPAGAGGLHLTLTSEGPVVVNTANHTAYLLSGEDGDVTRERPLDARPDDLISGGADQPHLLVVRPADGTLRWCEVDSGSCRERVRVGAARSRLGPAIEASGRVFVPDHTAGVVHIVDTHAGSVTDTPRLLAHTTGFELVARAGIVFFNDPDSQHAGVIAPDATVRRIDKYDPERPEPPDDGHDEDRPKPPTREPRPTPSVSDSGRPNPTAAPNPSASPKPGTTGTTPSPLPVPTRAAPDAGPPRILRMTSSPAAPITGERVSFAAQVGGAPPEAWAWSVTPLPSGTERVVSRSREMRMTFDAAQTYRVALTITRGAHQDRRTVDVAVVAAPPTVQCGEVVVNNITLRSDLRCKGDALLVGADDVVIDLNGHKITGSGGGIGVRNDTYSDLTIRDGTITGFERDLAISLSSFDEEPVDRTFVENVRLGSIAARPARNFRMTGGSIDESAGFTDSDDATFANVTFPGRISFANSQRWSITKSVVRGELYSSDNSNHGTITETVFSTSDVFFNQSNNLRFINNTVHGTLTLTGTSLDATVRGNTFRDAKVAIDLTTDCMGTVIEHNLFENNQIGIAGVVIKCTIRGNTFSGNAAAGIYIRRVIQRASDPTIVAGNTFRSNGHDAGGLRDESGRPVNDGLHINAPPDSNVIVSGNHSFNNADYGIEAPPGSVRDGGGNTSSGDPSGCQGVACG